MDSVFLALVVPQPISFIAKAEYFEKRSTAWLFRSTGQIPLQRGSSRAAVQALAEAQRVLGRNGVVGIYPEGTRSRDGRLHRGNTGVVRLARAAGTPIVPVGLVGTAEVQPPGRMTPRPFREVTIRFGPPQEPAEPSNRPAALRESTDRLMRVIAGLCDQEYVDSYAPLAA